MRPIPIACAALLFTGVTLATQDLDTPPAPPAPPAPPSARLAPPPPPPPPPPQEMALGLGGRVLHDLDLSAEQRRRIRALVDTARGEGLAEAGEALHDARHALERALWDPEADVSALRTAAAEAEDHLFVLRRQLTQQVLQVLTEDQRTELLRTLGETPTWGPPRP